MIEHRAYLLEVTDRRPNDVLLQELVDILARYSYTEFYWFDRRNGWGQAPSDGGSGGGQNPAAGGVRAFAEANPGALVREPLPIYLNPAVRD
jgi:hypothetical protein